MESPARIAQSIYSQAEVMVVMMMMMISVY